MRNIEIANLCVMFVSGSQFDTSMANSVAVGKVSIMWF